MSNKELIEEVRDRIGRISAERIGDKIGPDLFNLTFNNAIQLIQALEAAEAKRDDALAVIEGALAATKRGNLMTPPWVIAALNGEATG